MLRFYIWKAVCQLPLLMILVAAFREARVTNNWRKWMEFAGAALVGLYLVGDWILWNPEQGLLSDALRDPHSMDLLAYAQIIMLHGGVLCFAIGYFASSFHELPAKTPPALE